MRATPVAQWETLTLNYFKFWHCQMSEKKGLYSSSSKVIHITLAWHQNEIIRFEENLSTSPGLTHLAYMSMA